MNGCFRILMDEVHANEGTVNRFRGDGVMALFGRPSPMRIMRSGPVIAALAIQKALCLMA